MKRPPADCVKASAGPPEAADSPADAGSTIESIAAQALELANHARNAGYPAVGYMLEMAALEAAAAASASRWPHEA